MENNKQGIESIQPLSPMQPLVEMGFEDEVSIILNNPSSSDISKAAQQKIINEMGTGMDIDSFLMEVNNLAPAEMNNGGILSLNQGSGNQGVMIDSIDFIDSKEAQDEAKEDLDDYIKDFEDDIFKGSGESIDIKGKTSEQIAKEITERDTPLEKKKKYAEGLEGYNDYLKMLSPTQVSKGRIGQGVGAATVRTNYLKNGGIPSLMPMGMDDGGFATGFGFNFQDGFEDVSMTDEEREQYEEEVRRYNEAQNDPDAYNESINPAISFKDALSRGYGSPQADRIAEGIQQSKLNFTDTEPGVAISIDALDQTPESYRFYPSEVSKLYAQMKGVPFSPLVAPPKEATYVDSMQPRRIQSQLYAKDGTYVQGYADGTGRYGAQQLEPNQFPRRQELITGPGGERGDKIPAMLSDGEFVTNSAAVRGMGIMAGASPQDEYEQRLLGARQMYDFQKQAEEMAKRYA
tara:strand:+ start:51 stop:1433 length:1383 start_codon:yes stop_codon:yes gene_type:complete